MTSSNDGADDRGREAVCRRLVDAARELIQDRSPGQISGRELAKRAGVNYGLIHHYFGTKHAVFAAAMDEIAEEAFDELLDGGTTEPVPIDTSDRAYRFQTLAHLAMNGELDSIRRFPVTQRFVELRAESTGRSPNDPDVLAEVAAISVLQFGWSVFEEYFTLAFAPFEPDLDELRSRVASLSKLLRTPGSGDADLEAAP